MSTPPAAPAAEAAPAPRTAKGGGLALPLALLLVPGGAGVAFAKIALHAPVAASAKTPTVQTSEIIEMPELIVNLAESHGQRYLKVRVAIEVRSEDKEAAKARMAESAIAVRDGLIRLLSAKTLDVIDSSEAKESMRREVLDLVNKSVFASGGGTAEHLYFMEFIVQ
jgi:flagellar basal body-associated protein FliL